MIDSGGVVETMFEHLAVYDWDSFRLLLSIDIERIGPFGERVVGRDAYVELMAGGAQQSGDDGNRTTWDVHYVAYTHDRRSAFARVTAHVPQPELRIEQVLAFQLDENGLICRIEVFWRNPRSGPKS